MRRGLGVIITGLILLAALSAAAQLPSAVKGVQPLRAALETAGTSGFVLGKTSDIPASLRSLATTDGDVRALLTEMAEGPVSGPVARALEEAGIDFFALQGAAGKMLATDGIAVALQDGGNPASRMCGGEQGAEQLGLLGDVLSGTPQWRPRLRERTHVFAGERAPLLGPATRTTVRASIHAVSDGLYNLTFPGRSESVLLIWDEPRQAFHGVRIVGERYLDVTLIYGRGGWGDTLRIEYWPTAHGHATGWKRILSPDSQVEEVFEGRLDPVATDEANRIPRLR